MPVEFERDLDRYIASLDQMYEQGEDKSIVVAKIRKDTAVMAYECLSHMLKDYQDAVGSHTQTIGSIQQEAECITKIVDVMTMLIRQYEVVNVVLEKIGKKEDAE